MRIEPASDTSVVTIIGYTTTTFTLQVSVDDQTEIGTHSVTLNTNSVDVVSFEAFLVEITALLVETEEVVSEVSWLC